ncbi:MAG: M20/M25/M40 family metallo-hydrolase [Polyangiaceae bacterium]|nr:M20/M25/M40 family metallo-hydrolase [Polyangiaceae bacterium]
MKRSAVLTVACAVLSCQPAQVAPPPCPSVSPTLSTATAAPVASTAPPPDPRASLPKNWVDAADKIAAASKARTNAYTWLSTLTDSFGHRLSGSKALEGAIDFAVESMKKAGLSNARREKVMVPHWVRGKESARVVTPIEREIAMLGLGGSVGTGNKPIKGEVIVFDTLDDLKNSKDPLKNKVVLVNQPMPPFDPKTNETGYGTTATIRWWAASEAGKKGAVAALIRSVTAKNFRMPHTGSMAPYEKDGPKIPAAAIAPEDADYIARASKKGAVTIELSMGAKTFPDAESANAVAELAGSSLPNEVVVVGGHIDSWDVGDGANDDGAGCAMALDAVTLLKELQLVPKRTLRVVLFTNEENGLRGGKGYFEAHGKEVHIGAIESDFGAGAPRGFQVHGPAPFVAAVKSWTPLFQEWGAVDIQEGHTGADISPLEKAGVPCVGLVPDGSHYFDLHHSHADTIDKIDPGNLRKNAAALALMAYLLAEGAVL